MKLKIKIYRSKRDHSYIFCCLKSVCLPVRPHVAVVLLGFYLSIRSSVPIWRIRFICDTNWQPMKGRVPFQGQTVKGQGHTGRLKFLPCLLERMSQLLDP